MKKFLMTLTVTMLFMIVATPLFAAGVGETAVLRLTAYIAPKATFILFDEDLHIEANNNNFTYSIQEESGTRLLFVQAV